MSRPLVERPVRRLFTFGCSFTRWLWTGWPEILANHLDVPHWNFGAGGGGNQFMFTRLSQARQAYNIGPDDLVVICWTHFSREDRWCEKISDWELVGNIYHSNGVWDERWIKRWANSTHYALRDLSMINMTRTCLDSWGCQYHMMSMCDLLTNIDENYGHHIPEPERQTLVDLYQSDMEHILPSYYTVLWNNDLGHNKFRVERKEIHPMFGDGHPSPYEHLKYLAHHWPELQTSQGSTVARVDQVYRQYLKQTYSDGRKLRGSPGSCFPQTVLTHEEKLHLRSITEIRPSELFQGQIL